MPKVVMYEGIGDIFSPRRKHSSHVIKSSAVRKQNEKMKECAIEWKKKGKPGRYQTFVGECMKRGHSKSLSGAKCKRVRRGNRLKWRCD